MNHSQPGASWVPQLDRGAGPIYLLIAAALERDVRAGQLPPGTRLPAQRALAEALGVDFTTITRAYAEARRRGLIEGRTGQGTFVSGPAASETLAEALPASSPEPLPEIMGDMTMNLPPRFEAPALVRRMWAEASSCAAQDGGPSGFELMMQYHLPGGTLADRAAGARWLAERIPAVSAEQVLVTAGAQGALHALFGALLAPGGRVLSAALTYPGMIAAVEHLGLQPVALPMDGAGPVPDALEAAARHAPGAVLYLNPTLHNPTTLTIPEARRHELIAIARRHGLRIVEDDAYGALAPEAPPPFRALAPELTYHVAGLAKCLSPALRIAHLVLPDTAETHRYEIERGIRATSANASAIAAAIAVRWIESGTAAAVRDAIRAETRARHAIGLELLPEVFATHPPDAFHLWLALPERLDRLAFAAELRLHGLGVVAGDEFALGASPNAVRLSLGAARSAAALRAGLARVAVLLSGAPRQRSFVV